jgi:hypothetical protein
VLKAWVHKHIRMASIFRDFGAFIEHAVTEVSEELNAER